MKKRSITKRKITNGIVKVISALSAAVGLIFLGWILSVVVSRGVGALNYSFFTELPPPPGSEGGGLANALLGTFLITSIAAVIGIPVGLCTGIYLAEFGQGRTAQIIRSGLNVLMGLPSIIVGVFIFGLVVRTSGHFSGHAGSIALAIIMMPIIARTTEDMLRLIPNTLRESALALGMPRWLMINGIVFRAAKSGLFTGILLGIARIAGESAPLLFTALNSPYTPQNLNGPTANLPVTIFNYAMSPYPQWQSMAWGASLVITSGVLVLTIISRFYLRRGN